jgi:hypothetical protein
MESGTDWGNNTSEDDKSDKSDRTNRTNKFGVASCLANNWLGSGLADGRLGSLVLRFDVQSARTNLSESEGRTGEEGCAKSLGNIGGNCGGEDSAADSKYVDGGGDDRTGTVADFVAREFVGNWGDDGICGAVVFGNFGNG